MEDIPDFTPKYRVDGMTFFRKEVFDKQFLKYKNLYFLKENLFLFFLIPSITFFKTDSINLALNLFTSINSEEIVNEAVR